MVWKYSEEVRQKKVPEITAGKAQEKDKNLPAHHVLHSSTLC